MVLPLEPDGFKVCDSIGFRFLEALQSMLQVSLPRNGLDDFRLKESSLAFLCDTRFASSLIPRLVVCPVGILMSYSAGSSFNILMIFHHVIPRLGAVMCAYLTRRYAAVLPIFVTVKVIEWLGQVTFGAYLFGRYIHAGGPFTHQGFVHSDGRSAAAW